MGHFIPEAEIATDALKELVDRSYATFSTPDVTPLVKLSEDGSVYVLEQFHGPTCAFKDVALQFVGKLPSPELPHSVCRQRGEATVSKRFATRWCVSRLSASCAGNLFEFFLQRRNAAAPAGTTHRITVLGATSGDTGSAAIQGLRGKKNVDVFILHPYQRVAPVQEAQMTTVLDANVHNVAVDSTFDDCQTIVKSLFNEEACRNKHSLAAINSINWARILAQVGLATVKKSPVQLCHMQADRPHIPLPRTG